MAIMPLLTWDSESAGLLFQEPIKQTSAIKKTAKKLTFEELSIDDVLLLFQ